MKINKALFALPIASVFCFVLYFRCELIFLLWLGVFVSFCSVVLGILQSRNEVTGLLFIILFLASLRFLFILQTPSWGFRTATDSSHGLQLSLSMYHTERWTPGMGIERETGYSEFPASHLWTVQLAKVTGMNIVDIARFVNSLLCGPLTVILYYIALRPMLGRKAATWASLVFCLNFVFIFFDGSYVHESMGLVFYALYLAMVFNLHFQRRKYREFILIAIFASFAAVFYHHWSAYNILLISAVFLFLPNLYSYILGLRRQSFKRVDKPSLVFVGLAYVTALSWVIFIARNILVEHVGWGIDFLISILHPFGRMHPLPAMEIYTPIEKLLIVLGILVLIAVGGSELIRRAFSKRKCAEDLVLESWFIFSALYIFVLSYLGPGIFGPEQLSINYRSWPFAFFGLSPLIASYISRYTCNIRMNPRARTFAQLKPLVLAFPLISAVFLAPYAVRDPSFFPSADSCYSTALWAKLYLTNETIAIDEFSGCVIIPYGRIEFYKTVQELPLDSPANQASLLLYQSEESLYYAPEKARVIFFNNRITEGDISNTGISGNSSRLDNLCNRIYDSSTLTIYVRTSSARPLP